MTKTKKIKNKIFLYLSFLGYILIITIFTTCHTKKDLIVTSPDRNISVSFFSDKNNHNGSLIYTVKKGEKTIIHPSKLGIVLKNEGNFSQNISILHTSTKNIIGNYELPWGEQRKVENNANSLSITIGKLDNSSIQLEIECRVYNDGIGIRYNFITKTEKKLYVMEEVTQFNLKEDYSAFWIPGDWDTYEHLYTKSPISQIDALSKRKHSSLLSSTIPVNAVNTPVTLVSNDGTHLSFHEAALVDYPGMTLKVDTEALSFKSALVGSKNHEYLAEVHGGMSTPWRSILIVNQAKDLIQSNLIINLNEPNKLKDISWFKPTKYTGIWWEMHLGKSTWGYEGGKHGATTENAKKFIDFSAQHKIGGVLVEGWNTGWEKWIGFEDREGVFDFLTPYPDYNIEEVVKYGKSKGVDIIMHHETSAATATYEKQMDSAFLLMQKLDLHVVKTGYVGDILPKGEYHHNQYMVRHHQKVVDLAAKYKVAINAHEPIKPTGLRRTYPNIISREGLRGQEFNAWASDGGNPPNHLPIVAFTRMLAGPIDFTPGIFHISLSPYKDNNQINTTLAQQLALYVVIYSPIQMAADLVENYENNLAPFKFIEDVGVDWEKTVVLDGEVGEFVVIARQERKSNNWFLGAITNEFSREITIDFNFLEIGNTYELTIYQDTENSHYRENPTSIDIIKKENIRKDSKEKFRLAEGGGLAISIKKT